jgi:protein phosphatase 1 regulatory subunit 7
VQGLERVVNLQVLDVSNNRVSEVHGLEDLQSLRDLWLNDNQIAMLDDIEAAARAGNLSSTLTCLYITGNPATSQNNDDVRSRILAAFPNLEQLDDSVL